MKTRIVDFDIKKAKAGAKIVTRDGRNVRIVCYDVKGHVDFPILTLIDEGAYEATCFFTSKGKGISNIDNDSTLDLFIEEQQFEEGDFIAFGEDKENQIFGILAKLDSDVNTHDNYFVYPTTLNYGNWPTKNIRLATDEERQTLLDALAKEGKCWNADKKCIEELPKEHIFKPFEKVLVRDLSNECWKINLFSHLIDDTDYPYQCFNQMWMQCIPYEGNEELLGTTKNLNL